MPNRSEFNVWKEYTNPAREQIAASEWLIMASLGECSINNSCSRDELLGHIKRYFKVISSHNPTFFFHLSTGSSVEGELEFFLDKNCVSIDKSSTKSTIRWKITGQGRDYLKSRSHFAESVFGKSTANKILRKSLAGC